MPPGGVTRWTADRGHLPIAQHRFQCAGLKIGPGEEFGEERDPEAGAQRGQEGFGIVGAKRAGRH